MSQPPIFELIDERSVNIRPDLLGLWTTRARFSPEGIISFDTSQSDIENISQTEPVWRVNLPVNLNAAAAHLAKGKRALTQSQRVMQKAPEQITDLIKSRVSAASQSFAMPSGANEAEQELLTALNALYSEGQEINFGLRNQLSESWQQTTKQFQAFSERLIQSFTQHVLVETCVQGKCLGRSYVSWIGDIKTTWRRDVSKDHMKLHQEALTLALASRDSVMQSFALAIRVALQLATLIVSPGSTVLLLPAVWKYIQQMQNTKKQEFFH